MGPVTMILAECKTSGYGGTIKLIFFNGNTSIKPEAFLAAPELFEPMMEVAHRHYYRVESDRINARYETFEEAVERYLSLRKSWQATDVSMIEKVREYADRNGEKPTGSS